MSGADSVASVPPKDKPAKKEWVLETPEPKDFAELGSIKALGFAEKGLSADGETEQYRELQKSAPQKIQHCRGTNLCCTLYTLDSYPFAHSSGQG